MTPRRRIALGALAVIAALLALNTIGLDNQTRGARVTVPGARIMNLGGSSLQVLDTPSKAPRARRGMPIVLIHCYTCSMRWWDMVAPLLAERHRVIRVDLLGHGGSEKPAEGYDIDQQADMIAEAMSRLGVEGAMVVGHSLGATVATAIAQSHSELVDRVALIGIGPDASYADLGLPSKISRLPVIGQALWRITPNFIWRSGLGEAFAPGFDTANGFENPDQPVDDLRSMTYTAYDRWASAYDEWNRTLALGKRLAGANVPALIILGAEDQIIDTKAAAPAFRSSIPAAEVRVMAGVGHSPNVEAPEETAAMLESFAARGELGSGRGRKATKGKGPNRP